MLGTLIDLHHFAELQRANAWSPTSMALRWHGGEPPDIVASPGPGTVTCANVARGMLCQQSPGSVSMSQCCARCIGGIHISLHIIIYHTCVYICRENQRKTKAASLAAQNMLQVFACHKLFVRVDD